LLVISTLTHALLTYSELLTFISNNAAVHILESTETNDIASWGDRRTFPTGVSVHPYWKGLVNVTANSQQSATLH